MLSFKPIKPKQLHDFYEAFDGEKTFLQDAFYADFRKQVGERVMLWGAFEEEKLVGTALIQKVQTKFKTFLHCGHGPLPLTINNKPLTIFWDEFLAFYKELGRKENCDFVRISPLIKTFDEVPPRSLSSEALAKGEGGARGGCVQSNEKELEKTFKAQGFRPAPVHLVNPEKTWVLDISPSEEEILKNMKKSTRYEVRRIEKMGIETQMGNTAQDLDIFWDIHHETVKRQGFTPFPKKNTAAELEVYGPDCQIFSAKVEEKFMSSSVILFDKVSAYYHQGASLYSKAPVAHATIWAAIKEAKSRGCTEFNFWGVVGEDEKSHPWYGLSRFKKGFGGEERNYLHCQDFPITSKYWLNFALEKYRKWKKRY